MGEYKMNQYDLQSYFKSSCNSFCIAYEQVKRLEEERERLQNCYDEEGLETVKSLIKLGKLVTIPNKYVTSEYSRSELLKEKERLEKEEREYERKVEELEKILKFWSDNMWRDYEAIKSVLYRIKDNKFSIIVTTKGEVYALMRFYNEHLVKEYPVVNVEKEYRQAFSTGEELYDDFLSAYEEASIYGLERSMKLLYDKYF